MAHSEPKVTIDLSEYNSLLDAKAKAESNEDLLMAKQVICAFINSSYGSPPRDFEQHMRALGVSLQLISLGNGKEVSPDNIHVSKLERSKPFKTA